MTEDLKTRFEQLVADPPPPSAVPSEAVFARVRTARRRRTAVVGGLAVAAIVGISLTAGQLTDIGGAPPISNTPGAPKSVVTGPPTAPPKPKPPIQVALTMTVKGRTLQPRATVSGKAFMPKVVPEGTLVPDDTSFLNLSAGTTLDYGDKYQSGTDGGGLQCAVTKLKTGAETYDVEPHTYAKAGTYKFVYKIEYCGTRGLFTTTVVKQVTIR